MDFPISVGDYATINNIKYIIRHITKDGFYISTDIFTNNYSLLISTSTGYKVKDYNVQHSVLFVHNIDDNNKKYYIVTYIFNNDDYKHRGENWCDENTPKLFSTKEKALEYMRDIKINFVRGQIDDIDKWVKDLGLDEGELSPDLLDNHLNDYFENYNEGEFIPEKITLTIHEVELE